MSDKKEATNEKPCNEQTVGSTSNDRPQSVYIKNSDQSSGKINRKLKE